INKITNSSNSDSKFLTSKFLTLRDGEGNVITDPHSLSNMFAETFYGLGSMTATVDVGQDIPSVGGGFYLNPTDESEIERILFETCNKHSSGMDGVPCFILRSVASYISRPLAAILSHRTYLDHWLL
ncbi:hypothetical protein QE152_g41051, partial [Popillia japonica]